MGRLRTGIAAARRSPLIGLGVVVVVCALTATGVLLATRPGPLPAPQSSTRAVDLGDSVPYGHGLANPYVTPRPGLPARDVSQGPALQAYPSLVARALGLSMTVRNDNCDLTGDQLAISGAVADPADDTAHDTQCPVPPQQTRNLNTELAHADLAEHPARLVLLQAGADDIDFGNCLEYQLGRVFGVGIGLGTQCVVNGTVTAAVATTLAHARTSLADAIESMAPHAGTIAVLNYYQPVPTPSTRPSSYSRQLPKSMSSAPACRSTRRAGCPARSARASSVLRLRVCCGGTGHWVSRAVSSAGSATAPLMAS